MIHLFCGYEPQEAVGFHTFTGSVVRRASAPVSIVPLASMGLPHGSNSFTVSRFMVPYLMRYKGHAIFADASDMLMLDDIAKLDALFDPRYAVQVVQHSDYETSHARKYVGTSLECDNRNYSRKNWASLMLINCAHQFWSRFTPETIASRSPLSMLQFSGLHEDEIGALPDCWNRLADEGHPVEGASLLHWTAGIPAFAAYQDSPGADYWRLENQLTQEQAA